MESSNVVKLSANRYGVTKQYKSGKYTIRYGGKDENKCDLWEWSATFGDIDKRGVVSTMKIAEQRAKYWITAMYDFTKAMSIQNND